MEGNAEALASLIKNSSYTVFFGGAGVSTESGIPDFRSDSGVYSEKYGSLSPETLVSASFLEKDPEMFFSFYKEKLIYPEARPNKAHTALARLEEAGMVKCVITQNIDSLHSEAGSKNVIELHGTVKRNYCVRCREEYSDSFVLSCDGVPKCRKCGGMVRPFVTLFEEALPPGAFEKAVSEVGKSDLLIIAGTSLVVYPAASLVRYASGKVVLINLSPTPYDDYADMVFHDKVGNVMDSVLKITEKKEQQNECT